MEKSKCSDWLPSAESQEVNSSSWGSSMWFRSVGCSNWLWRSNTIPAVKDHTWKWLRNWRAAVIIVGTGLRAAIPRIASSGASLGMNLACSLGPMLCRVLPRFLYLVLWPCCQHSASPSVLVLARVGFCCLQLWILSGTNAASNVKQIVVGVMARWPDGSFHAQWEMWGWVWEYVFRRCLVRANDWSHGKSLKKETWKRKKWKLAECSTWDDQYLGGKRMKSKRGNYSNR